VVGMPARSQARPKEKSLEAKTLLLMRSDMVRNLFCGSRGHSLLRLDIVEDCFIVIFSVQFLPEVTSLTHLCTICASPKQPKTNLEV
jgi:hypothetical protein